MMARNQNRGLKIWAGISTTSNQTQSMDLYKDTYNRQTINPSWFSPLFNPSLSLPPLNIHRIKL